MRNRIDGGRRMVIHWNDEIGVVFMWFEGIEKAELEVWDGAEEGRQWQWTVTVAVREDEQEEWESETEMWDSKYH